jgi:hypothetical protein
MIRRVCFLAFTLLAISTLYELCPKTNVFHLLLIRHCFPQLHRLTEAETLGLFGGYYRDDVLANPDGTDHGNIRSFMLNGWVGIKFDSAALVSLT